MGKLGRPTPHPYAAQIGARLLETLAEYREIDSIHGHDAFLLETEQVGAILAEALASVAPVAVGGGA